MPSRSAEFVRLYRPRRGRLGVSADIRCGTVTETDMSRRVIKSPEMPIYEYDCSDCRRRVSVLVRTIATASDARCPRCGGDVRNPGLIKITHVHEGDGDTAAAPQLE